MPCYQISRHCKNIIMQGRMRFIVLSICELMTIKQMLNKCNDYYNLFLLINEINNQYDFIYIYIDKKTKILYCKLMKITIFKKMVINIIMNI